MEDVEARRSEGQQACAHLRVVYTTEQIEGGRTRGWWACDSCKAKFTPVSAAEYAMTQAVQEYRTKARGSMAAGVECDLCEEIVTEWEWVDKGWSLACRPCLDKIRAQAVKEKDAFGTELSNKKAQITELLRHQNVLHKEIARLRPAVEGPAMSEHTDACWAMPICLVCGRRKKPHGRSAPLEMASSLCDHECPGYTRDQQSGHLWPGESADE